MDEKRRTFIKLAGLSLLGLGAKPVVSAFAEKNETPFSPGPEALVGKRWAMVVDIKKCKEDCNDCIKACHTTHNVPAFDNPEDEVKWIWRESYKHTFPGQENEYTEEYEDKALGGKKFLVLCNHCDNPPCVRVCPTKATWKREDGIVMMDYHRCIGCRFCMAGCPYGSRSLNWRDPRPFLAKITPQFPTRTRGVVEKCNFCTERLAQGLMPACVEACKEKALVFGDLEDPRSEVRELLRNNHTIRRKPQLGTMPQVYYIA